MGKKKNGTFAYSYDVLNRIQMATYNNSEKYKETFSYDANGNILTLTRNNAAGTAKMDDMIYNYGNFDGNKLSNIQEMGDIANGFIGQNTIAKRYEYDENGNLKQDNYTNHKIEGITYNYLNLPSTVTFTEANKIMYLYSASGTKLIKSVYKMKTNNRINSLYYCNQAVYDGQKTLLYILTDEGRILPDGTAWKYEYYMKDHLGNTRAVFQTMPTGNAPKLIQETQYFSFGGEIATLCWNDTTIASPNKYLYNGKEKQSVGSDATFCMDWLDYGARMYDATVGRWWSVDPLAEKGRRWSPYVYAADNPIRYFDPDGMWFNDANEKTADKIRNRAERRAEKLDARAERREAKGKDASKLKERSTELRKTAQDIVDMRNSKTEFCFAKMNDKTNPKLDNNGKGVPITARTGENQVTMFMETFNNVHEARHGGQIARGEYDVNAQGQGNSSYGASHEISAYRAELAFAGSFNYATTIAGIVPYNQILNINKLQTINITEFSQINNNMLRYMVEQAGNLDQKLIYGNNPSEWWKK